MKTLYTLSLLSLLPIFHAFANSTAAKIDWEGFDSVLPFEDKYLFYSNSSRYKNRKMVILSSDFDVQMHGKHPFDLMFKICYYHNQFFAIVDAGFSHKIVVSNDLVNWSKESLNFRNLKPDGSFTIDDICVYKEKIYCLIKYVHLGKLYSLVVVYSDSEPWNVDLLIEENFTAFGNSGKALFLIGDSTSVQLKVVEHQLVRI